MRPVNVLIFHAEPPADAGPLVRLLAGARHALAVGQRDAFLAAGADEVRIVTGPADGLSFGERLVRHAPAGGGVIVLGSGGLPLARAADLRQFVDVAAGPGGRALANNRYSADVTAIADVAALRGLPPLPADNALPRWLEERAGLAVADLRGRWRLAMDLDSPADLAVLQAAGALPMALRAAAALASPLPGSPLPGSPLPASPLPGRLAALRAVLADRGAELLVTGRVSSTTLVALERHAACRVRALVEERGLRAASELARSARPGDSRPPRSVLGELLDRDGPAALPSIAARLGDAAVVDTRVLLAHRCGADESGWPSPEDRFASDLLLPAAVADPWLRALTEGAVASDRPILLGGHSLATAGLRLLASPSRRRALKAPGNV